MLTRPQREIVTTPEQLESVVNEGIRDHELHRSTRAALNQQPQHVVEDRMQLQFAFCVAPSGHAESNRLGARAGTRIKTLS